jgi:hypothetical protein
MMNHNLLFILFFDMRAVKSVWIKWLLLQKSPDAALGLLTGSRGKAAALTKFYVAQLVKL